ncbi:unnamed protein product [Polarella glacialis]|uniref:Uncharacterized protein n=1 Tax=Polarella glacialis TaxID=89957 RepID=A0A813DD91_POLGL|nr:unnamed protein product [Polarella glacialis]
MFENRVKKLEDDKNEGDGRCTGACFCILSTCVGTFFPGLVLLLLLLLLFCCFVVLLFAKVCLGARRGFLVLFSASSLDVVVVVVVGVAVVVVVVVPLLLLLLLLLAGRQHIDGVACPARAGWVRPSAGWCCQRQCKLLATWMWMPPRTQIPPEDLNGAMK